MVSERAVMREALFYEVNLEGDASNHLLRSVDRFVGLSR